MKTAPTQELRQAEVVIAYVLRYGVLVSAFLIVVGFVLTLIVGGGVSHESLRSLIQGQEMSQSVQPPSSFLQFKQELTQKNPEAVIALGLLCLIILPVLRVAMTVFFFLFERDYLYLTITLFVLTILLTSLFLGKSI